MAKYLYFALFEQEDEQYIVSFPDLPGGNTFGEDLSDALHMAKDALEGHLLILEDEKEEIPSPSKSKDIIRSKH